MPIEDEHAFRDEVILRVDQDAGLNLVRLLYPPDADMFNQFDEAWMLADDTIIETDPDLDNIECNTELTRLKESFLLTSA